MIFINLSLNMRFREGKSSLIYRFFLNPIDFAVFIQLRENRVKLGFRKR
jgi:hypothetical protein